MINKKVKKEHILEALNFIDKNGVPPKRNSTKYNLHHKNKSYPPKYVLSIATKIATGMELNPSQFNGGYETNKFLSTLGFTIREGNNSLKTNTVKAVKINICTALIKIPLDNWDDITNAKKFKLLSEILSELPKQTDILVLPASFLYSKSRAPRTIFNKTENKLTELIKKHNKNLFICLGIDSDSDQLALAINKTGIISIARKFHHMDNEINLAENAFTTEDGKERSFTFKGKTAYLAVCYDIYGISKLKLENKNKYDFIIGLIHGFDFGGDVDFARKGLAGASKQWKVPSYASAVFSFDRNPENWPSGVEWKHENASVKDFKYEQIRRDSELKILETDIAKVYLRNYEE